MRISNTNTGFSGVPFQRLQFPIQLAFCITIDRSQGQSLERIGFYIEKDLFTHGQWYVAMSRSTLGPQGIYICQQIFEAPIKNIVFRDIFNNNN